jgi:hypothetical protein
LSLSERVTVRILEALGRYEDVDDLPIETVQGILYDEALRQRLSTPRPVLEEADLVRNALIQQQKETADELVLVKTVVEELTEKLETVRAESTEAITRSDRVIFVERWVIAPACISMLLVAALAGGFWHGGWPRSICIAVTGLYFLGWSECIVRIGSKRGSVKKTKLFGVFCRWRKWLARVIAAVVLGALGNGLYEGIKTAGIFSSG